MRSPNKIYVTLSLALVLFLLGFVVYWALRIDQLSQQLQDQLDVVVELEADHSLEDRRKLLAYLGETRFHNPLTAPQYESKEAALSQLDRDFTEDLKGLGVDNPLLDVVTFNVLPAYLSEDSLRMVAEEVQLRGGVQGVFYQTGVIAEVAGNAQRITYGLIGLMSLFLIITTILIHNTVRLSLAANRMIIRMQELVGASWGFIARPYLLRGLFQGLAAGLLAVAGLGALLLAAHRYLPELNVLNEPLILVWIGAGMVGLSVLVSFLSYYVGVRRYLRLPIDRL